MNKDYTILRELAKQTAEIAAQEKQNETRCLWRRLNKRDAARPMVMIDQICWHEMNTDDELTLQCQDKELRGWENALRQQLYQWRHFPVDSVVENFFRIPKAMPHWIDLGIYTQEEQLVTDHANDVRSHAYIGQIKGWDDVERIRPPVIVHDQPETNRREGLANEIFMDILPVRMEGFDPNVSVWDPLCTWMGVENMLLAMIDEPELMKAIATKMVQGIMNALDQMEEQGLLCGPQSLIHCTGAWTDDFPESDGRSTRKLWMFGLAQMFSTISPAMFEEYEVNYAAPICERFGLVYYGCCDPLDNKMNEVRKIKGLRKVSISPWANRERGAAEIGKDFVFSFKPNPAYLATSVFDEELVRKDLVQTMEICKKNNSPLEIILKDLSTVNHDPTRLWKWVKIAMEVVQR
jgi:hypothetical protein